MKDVKLVTVDQAKKHPSPVSLGHKICSKCQKEIAKLPTESNQDYLGDLSDDIATSPRRSSQSSGNKDVISSEDTFSCLESDLETMNKSLGFIGISPLKKHKALTTASYLPKKHKVHEAVSEKFENVHGPTSLQAWSNVTEGVKGNEIVKSLIERYKKSDSRPGKMTILTIVAPMWTRKMMIEKCGCSHRMAVQAKRLASERGILATQDSKRGQLLAAEIAECVKSFYYREDISRLLPGKKTALQ